MKNAFRLLSCIVVLAATNSASAAQRTFVASYGLAANTAFNCSIAKPCRAFSEAISVTDPAGEVIVLDSAGYGPVTIAQSVSIIAPAGVYAGVSVLSGDGIVVGASAAAKVVLRGLTINGQGGARGIVFLTGGQLVIDRCTVSGMTGNGIDVGAGAGITTIAETVTERNGGHGIRFVDRATGVSKAQLMSVRSANNGLKGVLLGAGAQARISSSVFHGNVDGGIWAITGVTSGTPMILDVSKSVISANGGEGIVATVLAGSTSVQALVADNVVTDNAFGIDVGLASGATGTARAVVSRNEVRGNSVGISAVGANTQVVFNANVVTQSDFGIQIQNAIVRSRGDNVVDDNTTNQTGASVPANAM